MHFCEKKVVTFLIQDRLPDGLHVPMIVLLIQYVLRTTFKSLAEIAWVVVKMQSPRSGPDQLTQNIRGWG